MTAPDFATIDRLARWLYETTATDGNRGSEWVVLYEKGKSRWRALARKLLNEPPAELVERVLALEGQPRV